MLDRFCGEPLDKERPYIALYCALASVLLFLLASYQADNGAEIPRPFLMISLFFNEWAPIIRLTLFAIATICIPATFLLFVGLFMVMKINYIKDEGTQLIP